MSAQSLEALVYAQEKRLKYAALRRQVRDGDITLAELLADPPDEIAGWPCIDVIRMTCWKPRHSSSLERLGRLAVRDGINLLMPIGRTSPHTRRWIAERAAWHKRKPGRGRVAVIVVKDAA